MIDKSGLADFLRRRRAALQPEDVGLPRGLRRRTSGLRREEAASLSHMSTVYYTRLEQMRGSRPSARMLASIAQGFHLTLDERDQLFTLAGRNPPAPEAISDHIGPGLLRTFDRLGDTPAEIVNEIGVTLRQNTLGAALTGSTTGYTGFARSVVHRWFTDPEARRRYLPEDHESLSLDLVAQLRRAAARRGPGSPAARIAERLRTQSTAFAALWDDHTLSSPPSDVRRFAHPEVGRLELSCQSLIDPVTKHSLTVYLAVPGSESYEKLALLSVIGTSVF